MDQVQWMINLIPDAILNWLYWLIIVAGLSGIVAGWLGKWIPIYGKYVKIFKPLGVFLLVLGVWLRGGYDTEMRWRAKVAEVQAKVAKAEEQSQELNTKLASKIKEKAKVRVQYYTTVKDRIVKETQVIDAECKVAPEVIKDLNDAAKNPLKTGTVTVEEVKK